MTFFKKWLYKYFFMDVKTKPQYPFEFGSQSKIETNLIQHDNYLDLRIFVSSGGWVVQYKKYIEKNDSITNKLYIIKDDQNLGEELVNIITINMLRQ